MKKNKSLTESNWFFASLIMPWIAVISLISLHEFKVIDILSISPLVHAGIIFVAGVIPLLFLLIPKRP